ncbi:uncharacterized protein BJX67DRAFT_264456 [Aspergillus lucknowensis]|uniref:Uncharacterized protein n=1 Tax=Aspergillus lucknowensis TaxID=176173 RepID=A0ABR4LIM0_9EURO
MCNSFPCLTLISFHELLSPAAHLPQAWDDQAGPLSSSSSDLLDPSREPLQDQTSCRHSSRLSLANWLLFLFLGPTDLIKLAPVISRTQSGFLPQGLRWAFWPWRNFEPCSLPCFRALDGGCDRRRTAVRAFDSTTSTPPTGTAVARLVLGRHLALSRWFALQVHCRKTTSDSPST